jgi:glycosyltransferase involved in cell wall biosynthesis
MMAPLGILQVLEKTGFATGSVVQMFEGAVGLARLGHRVTVVTRPDAGMARRCRETGLDWVGLPLRHELDVASMRRLARVARVCHADLVHAHKGVAHSVALGATHLGAHFTLVANRGVSFPIGALAAFKYRSRRVSFVVTVCEAIRQIVIASARLRPERVRVVYAGVNTGRFDPDCTSPQRIRDEFALPSSARVVGHVGMRDWKGWKELLQAFPTVRASHPDAHLLLVACTSERQRTGVLELAAELGLAGAVTATLAREDMPDVLAACDVVVDPSWAGTGITGTIREAMALGKPVVATAVAGNPELVEDGAVGLLVPPRDSATLAAAISRLLRDGELSLRLGSAARRRIQERFSTAVRVSHLEALYREALAERTGARP